MLEKEINLNKKFIIILLFLCVISIGMYSSYAYYEVSVIKNSVIVLKTAEINLNLEVVDHENNTFTIPKNDSITITVNLTSTNTGEIGYKLYYILNTNNTDYDVSSDESFNNNVIEGNLTSSKQITLTFTNNSSEDISITLGANGGLKEYPMVIDKGEPLLIKSSPKPLKDQIVKAITDNTTSTCSDLTVEEDETTYLSGTKDCINFNYVWYSGKLWQITAINQDGTMKAITYDPITTISYGSDANFYDISKKNDASYTGSYIYQFLNEDFLDTLYNYQNIIIEDSTWNTTITTNETTKLPETTLINKENIGKNTPVGLLNSYEYYLSYKNASYSSGYLYTGNGWWLLNKYNSTKLWLDLGTFLYNFQSSTSTGVRPTVIFKSEIQYKNGIGTKDNPYIIADDKSEPTINTTLLNTRTIGEYVVFDEDRKSSTKELYRIVDIENEKIKLNKNDYIKISESIVADKKFSTSTTYGNGTSDDYWDYYLNNTWYNSLASKSMLDKGTYYIKTMSSGSYKNSLCNANNTTETTKNCVKTTDVWNGYVGLPRYGEMFASQQEIGSASQNYICLITPSSTSSIWSISLNGGAGNDITKYVSARPSIFLKSNVVITGGTGTPSDPFTIALK